MPGTLSSPVHELTLVTNHEEQTALVVWLGFYVVSEPRPWALCVCRRGHHNALKECPVL